MGKIAFDFNSEKALEAILYVLEKKESVNQYNILKIMFEADKYHLNHYGRPITGDVYIKMEHGTVPSNIKDILYMTDGESLTSKDLEQYHIKGLRFADKDVLSESDIEALDNGCEKYLNLSFTEVRRLNHKEECWLQGKVNQQIPFESIISNSEVLDYLRETEGLQVVV